jgi:hypothetical protein
VYCRKIVDNIEKYCLLRAKLKYVFKANALQHVLKRSLMGRWLELRRLPQILLVLVRHTIN